MPTTGLNHSLNSTVPNGKFIVLVGDMIGSRRAPNRSELQVKFERVLDQLNDEYRADIAAGCQITLGDEFQGLLTSGSRVRGRGTEDEATRPGGWTGIRRCDRQRGSPTRVVNQAGMDQRPDRDRPPGFQVRAAEGCCQAQRRNRGVGQQSSEGLSIRCGV